MRVVLIRSVALIGIFVVFFFCMTALTDTLARYMGFYEQGIKDAQGVSE